METYERLENEFSDFVGMRQGEMVACSSGTAALHLALEALELPLGSKVLMSDYTMIACPRAASLAGLVPKFVDCNADDLLMGTTNGKRDRDTSAILATHIYGRRVNMKRVVEEADPRGLAVVEDLAEIHGVSPQPSSDAACWSFYKNKIIAGEEGGMIWFNDPGRAKIARELRSLGFNAEHNFLHRPRGHNYRLSNCHASLILDSLMRFSENTTKRDQVENWYNDFIPLEWQMPLRDAVWVYDLRIKDLGFKAMDSIIRELNGKGIAARHGFKPMTMQQEYYSEQISPNAERAAYEVLYLPVHPLMTQSGVKGVVEALMRAVESAGRE